MIETPLTKVHSQMGARMVDYAGYNMPVEYKGVIAEHMAVREKAGIFDVSHMGEFMVEGPGSLSLLQYVTTNDVSKIVDGQAQYTCFPNENGGIVDDLIIYRFQEEKFMIIVNAANLEKDWEWINKHNTFGAKLTNISDDTALMALQGPLADKILQKLTDANLESMKSFHFIETSVGNVENVLIAATGYTGAGGYELSCSVKDAENLWKSILNAGEPFELQPAGLGARDTLRLEMGYCLYGNDINDSTSPLEAGLGWVTKLKKDSDFISKDYFIKQKEEGVKKKLIGIELLERGIPRNGYEVLNTNGDKIGEVTSGTQSPILQKGIGMAYVNTDEAKPGAEVLIQIRNRQLKAKIVKFPFLKDE
ncbi:MAG: glycine cleavage system aminomethyltransferase GcvT [Bacteroidales bacterium]|nr:glycine cleavage system aminomethyltransferase GcvT [Bacteroidales bacterium]